MAWLYSFYDIGFLTGTFTAAGLNVRSLQNITTGTLGIDATLRDVPWHRPISSSLRRTIAIHLMRESFEISRHSVASEDSSFSVPR
jgi:hypothetical protein